MLFYNSILNHTNQNWHVLNTLSLIKSVSVFAFNNFAHNITLKSNVKIAS